MLFGNDDYFNTELVACGAQMVGSILLAMIKLLSTRVEYSSDCDDDCTPLREQRVQISRIPSTNTEFGFLKYLSCG